MNHAGFWRRLAAFAIDLLLLGTVGQLCGLVAFDQLASLGGWGRLIGLVLSVLYFGVLDSRLGGGQTLGKRLLGIVLYHQAGQRISPVRSALRYLVIALPLEINALSQGPGDGQMGLSMLQAALSLGVGLACLHMMIFNRRQGQWLPDVLCRTLVLRKQPGDLPNPVFWRGHAYAGLSMLALAAALPPMLAHWLNAPVYGELTRVANAVQAVPGVRAIGVQEAQKGGTSPEGAPPTVFLQVSAQVDQRARLTQTMANQVARAALPQMAATDRAGLVIALRYGFNIGIASRWMQYNVSHSPAEWRQLLLKP
ncbi:hypothetical protein THUN1379_17920 [Paludibacterium sp. THUN1379]|uniref:RDD family protein n=1 Tax=Paludibacterium sp. THUN1379 TaxID=3112107 RepID=UPI003087417C|nr:hypothetical protein THUN1379_17920 [Paludibacterium sp. THUN1379]